MKGFNCFEPANIIRKKRKDLKRYGVKKIGIFGSCARGEDIAGSDIDVIVEFEEGKKSYNNFIELYFFLKDLLGKEIDLLTPEGISPYIKPHILKEVVFI